jgi:hypothetical protein
MGQGCGMRARFALASVLGVVGSPTLVRGLPCETVTAPPGAVYLYADTATDASFLGSRPELPIHHDVPGAWSMAVSCERRVRGR